MLDGRKKSNKKIYIIIGAIFLILIIGGTIAYFMSRQTGSEQTITSGNLSISYLNENAFNITDMIPIDEASVQSEAAKVSFTIQNDGNLKAYVEIGMTDITIPEEFKNQDFKYALYDAEGNNITTGDFSSIGSSTDLIIYQDIEFNVGDSKDYTLYIWINETPGDQTAMMNKTFKGKMQITGYLKPVNYKDNSGANSPKLASGMIPVVYDSVSENWEVADTSSEWYNYDEQWWANAVTVSDASYRTAEAGTEIPMSSINSMWVWIPRYKYKIPSNIGSSSNVTSPPEIDVVFESGTNTTGTALGSCPITSTTCYYTHPAFRNGSVVYKSAAYDQGGWDKELEGIWVGKFETGTEGDTCSSSPSATNCQNVSPVIKPEVVSLRYQTVSTQFDTSLKFAGGTRNTSNGEVTFSGNSTYGLTSSTDTHMMKNTEWGAVAYLSQSKYGKMGNANYSGANKEIYINNSSGTYTGRSGGGPGGSTPVNGTYPDQTSTTQYNTYGFYTYDDYLLNYNTNTKGEKVLGKGTGASTTGTIYGIYDMSGGAYDRTMGNWAGTLGSSGFTTSNLPGGSSGSKYYEKYTGTSSSSITSAKSIKGDATYETKSWYSDYIYFPYASSTWSNRGGHYSASSSAGAFSSLNNDGASSSGSGFRVALIP